MSVAPLLIRVSSEGSAPPESGPWLPKKKDRPRPSDGSDAPEKPTSTCQLWLGKLAVSWGSAGGLVFLTLVPPWAHIDCSACCIAPPLPAGLPCIVTVRPPSCLTSDLALSRS